MKKVRVVCMAAAFLFLFLVTVTYAARPTPASSSYDIPHNTQHAVLEEEKASVEETCEGMDKEECLMRRTLAAHTDYIYTQKKQKP